MRRWIRGLLRVALLGLLALAFFDPPIPRRGPRTRIYAIDASDSVRATTGRDAFTPQDALRLASHDRTSLGPQDQAALIAFGAKPSILAPLSSQARFDVRLDGVDGSSTDLRAAIEMAAALAGEGEIVLFSDGRSTTGRVPVEKLKVPVHTMALGPVGGVDAAIRAIDAPATARPGADVTIRISVETTGAWKGEIDGRPIEFTGPGRQDVVVSRKMPAGDLTLEFRLQGGPDLCPQNDRASFTVSPETEAVRVLIVTTRGDGIAAAFGPPEWTATTAADLSRAAESDVVILDGIRADALSRGDLDRLARLVKEEGVGLVMTGGSSSYALGGWNGTPAEDLLPFWAFPDERSAVVIALDRSGSMSEPAPGRSRPRIEEAANAVRLALKSTHDDDELAIVLFASTAEVACPLVSGRERGRAAAALQGVTAGGSTVLARALTLAGATAKTSKAGRRHLVLITDGKSEAEEGEIRAAARGLREDGIRVTVVRIGDSSTPALAILRESGAQEIDGSDFARLDSTIADALARSRELTYSPSVRPTLAEFGEIPRPALLNRVSLKPGSEVLGRAGDVPIVALRHRVAASTISFEQGWAGDLASWERAGAYLRWLASRVAPSGRRLPAELSVRFEEDGLEIAAALRGSERPDTFEVTVDGAPVRLARRGENTYVGRVKDEEATIRIGGRIAAVARRPHPPEFDRVGPDFEALKELSNATGGRLLDTPRDLAALPGRTVTRSRSARTLILIAALVVFLMDVALGILPVRSR